MFRHQNTSKELLKCIDNTSSDCWIHITCIPWSLCILWLPSNHELRIKINVCFLPSPILVSLIIHNSNASSRFLCSYVLRNHIFLLLLNVPVNLGCYLRLCVCGMTLESGRLGLFKKREFVYRLHISNVSLCFRGSVYF